MVSFGPFVPDLHSVPARSYERTAAVLGYLRRQRAGLRHRPITRRAPGWQDRMTALPTSYAGAQIAGFLAEHLSWSAFWDHGA
jgi:hypothetical protein